MGQADVEFRNEDEVIPHDLRLVRDFVNTAERQEDTDSLQTVSDLDAWLAAHGLADASQRADASDLALALALREGFRAVMLHHAGHHPDGSVLARLEGALDAIPVRLSFAEPDRPGLVPRTTRPTAAALSGIVAAVQRSMVDGSWIRLKACSRPTCQWAYYDHSKNRSARWCTMAGCGNAMKMQRRRSARA